MHPFESVYTAINYYVFKNPARQIFIDLTESQSGGSKRSEQFTGDHSADLWASICKAIQHTLDSQRPNEKRAFELYYFRRAADDQSKKQIAKDCGADPRCFSRIIDDLEVELVRREIIPKPEMWR